MASVHFEHLYLLSSVERRALSVPLDAPKVVIQGGNGAGKSVILKALWQALGATPQSIDARWTGAQVSSCLLFRHGSRRYASLRTMSTHALFDVAAGELLFTGRRLVADWGPLFAEQFGFKLQMADRNGAAITPPAAYMFAPWYIDQDKSWTKAWDSFADFSALPGTAKTLADFHSGLKPNEYYAAQASARQERLSLNTVEASISTLRESIEQIEGVDTPASPTLDMDLFQAETGELVKRSNDLLVLQGDHRRSVLDLHEEIHLVRAERDLLKAALAEMRGEFAIAVGIPGDVECPTCGYHYDNGLAERFSLIQDDQVLSEAIGAADKRLIDLGEREAAARRDVGQIELALTKVQQVLGSRRASVSLNDVVVAAGRTEAIRLLQSGLDEKAVLSRTISDRIDKLKATMASFTDRKRSKEINDRFSVLMANYSHLLDVSLDKGSANLSGIKAARGSEGPRALLAYYYAFLQVSAQFSDSLRFPIVVDAPNQQGQDASHLPKMLDFVLSQAPADSQIIVATEDVGDLDVSKLVLLTYSGSQRQVLRSDAYEAVAAVFKPYQDAILASTAGDPESTQ